MKNHNYFPLALIRQRAFTLIEVMAAVAVFTISSVGLYSINQQNVFLADHLESKTIAHWLAMNTYAELSIEEEIPAIGQQSDNKTMAKVEWEVSTTVEQTALQTVRRVTIVVVNSQGQEYARLVAFLGTNKPDRSAQESL